MHFALCERTLSPARHVMEDTSYQTRPKIDAGDTFLLMGSINQTRFDYGALCEVKMSTMIAHCHHLNVWQMTRYNERSSPWRFKVSPGDLEAP